MVGKLVAWARDLGTALVRWVAGAALVAAATGAWGSTITYFHNDLAGSPVAATNSSGQVVWRESYRPYGERLVNSASAKDNDVWFTSRRQDSSGLVYMGARYYDPLAGRFASTDPRGFDEASVQGFNRYAYANDNPYRYVDPDGQVGVDIIFVALDAYSIPCVFVIDAGALRQRLGVVGGMALTELCFVCDGLRPRCYAPEWASVPPGCVCGLRT